ncbi:MAG: phospholipase D-like domain-containing protein, partial [Akkermansiaceae bacterium]
MKVIPPRVRKQIDQWRERIADELSQDSTGGVSIGNDVEVYFDGDRAFRAMIGAIAEAQEQVHLEMYMFLSDQTGRLFADALIKKAKEGIQVRVIYDAIGSADASDMMWGDMRAAGVQVEEYRPVSLWRKHGLWLWRGSLLGRNHRKTLVVDSTTAFTGGMNLGDPWSRNATGEKAWRDTQICVSGPAAAHLDELFVDSWKYCTGETVPLLTPHREPNQQQDRGCKCLVVGSRGIGGRKTIRSLFSVHLERAQKSVNMT